ncbi:MULTISPECIES: S41 family peptidase [Gluconobacter]|uniref:Tricorn protease homolog n=1 Tax=Gluconobacter cadivus TaxID=2728101 RepID=A0ABR9YVH0_9PROT|nr:MULTISPECIES: S41 family peptidase [Gluconobacter]MBF0887902.1 Tricorn protease-like protein [Gluconobacter cadivus]
MSLRPSLRNSLLSCAALMGLGLGVAQAEPGYLREPSISGQTVLFNAEQSVWSVPLAGGQAQRLTTVPQGANAIDPHPVISPDGTQIAFAANFDGPTEIYIMPRSGGTPRRLTFENVARLKIIGWDAHAGVLYASPAATGPYYSQTVSAIDPKTGATRVFPLSGANDAALSPDGRWLYAVRFGLATTGDHMRAYRGGALSQLWRFDLQNGKEAERIGTRDANLIRPMPWRDRLIVISDENGRYNLWSLATDGSDAKQLTHFTDYSVLEAAISGDHIVFRKGADLFDFNLASGETTPVKVDLTSDNLPRSPYWLEKPTRFLTSSTISPKGDAAAFTMRGHVVVAGASPRRVVVLATPDNVRLRLAQITPDGKSVIAFSDAGGDSALWRFAADGSGKGEAITQPSSTEPVALSLSPDGKYAAHTDLLGRLWLTDLSTKADKLVDNATLDGTNVFDSVSWSPDGHVLAYVRTRGTNLRRQIALYVPATGQSNWVTDGRYESYTPSFSPDGKWLWFLSDRTFSLANGSPWGDRNIGPAFPKRTGIYALALQSGERFPFQPATELDPTDKKPDADKKDDKKKDGDKKKSLPAIEWAGIATRLYQAPVPAGDYEGLGVSDDYLFTIDNSGSGDGPGDLKSIHIDNNEHKIETYATKISGFDITPDGKTLLTLSRRGKNAPELLLTPAGEKQPKELDGKKIDLDHLRLRIDPGQEWSDEFVDAWRLHRDHYYDRDLHGVDWKAVRAHFAPFVDRLGDRADLDDLLGQMVAEIGAMHSQLHAPTTFDQPASSLIAGLGAHLTHEDKGFRIDHIYQGDRDLPDQQSPLAAPGVDARNGDLITAINGQPTAGQPDLGSLLADQAGKQVLLTLARGGKDHKIIVTPVSYMKERDLRARDWEVSRAEIVDRASHGRIGYLHLQSMVGDDMEAFAREFYANIDKDGLIVDVRGNTGGNIDSWVLTQLMRRPWMFWGRYGNAPSVDMQQSFQGRLIVLSDEMTYSDGETFSQGIKSLHIAPLLGERTAGAGVWLSDGDRLIDNGNARTAENPYFDLNGQWLVENKGVSPDIEVENMPVATFNGQDQQLDAALTWLRKDMADHPRPTLKPAPFPPQQPAAPK